MKKTKKLLSLFVVMAMLVTCVLAGTLSASAVTDTYGDETVLSNADSLDGWGEPVFLSLHMDGTGNKIVQYKRDAMAFFVYNFDAKNLSAYNNTSGYLYFRVYLEDASKLSGTDKARVELKSGEGHSSMVYVGDYAWQNGWNDVYVPISSLGTEWGGADWTAVNYFRLYFNFTGSMQIAIDKVSLCKKGDYTPAAATPVAYGTKKALPIASATVATNAGVAVLTTQEIVPPMDASAYATNGYLHIKVYVDHAAKLTGGQIELTSSAGADNNETSWDLNSLWLVDGWNEFYLPISSGNKVGGDTNFAALNYFRLFALCADTDTVNVGLDEAYLCLVGADPLPPVTYGAKLNLGVGAKEANGTDEAIVIVDRRDSAIDLSNYAENGFLHIKIYVDDVAKLTGGQLELSSSGTSDQNEIHWNILELGLKDGWNELYLPVSDAIAEGGSMDFSGYNYFRLYGLQAAGGSGLTLKVDETYMCLEGDAPDVIATGVSEVESLAFFAAIGVAALLLGAVLIYKKRRIA